MTGIAPIGFAARVLSGIADIAWPRICPVCGDLSDRAGRHICWDCLGRLEEIAGRSGVCAVCGNGIDAKCADGLCHDCRKRRPDFDMARSALKYEPPARELVHGFKYRNDTWLAADFADLLESCARAAFDLREADAILPVPLHPAKFVLRSYNQSSILAGALSRRTGIPCRPDALRRIRDTPTQTRLGAKARKANIAGAFKVAKPEAVCSRTVLLVDDVMTTGATMDEVAKTLKAAGAWRVWCLTLCRA